MLAYAALHGAVASSAVLDRVDRVDGRLCGLPVGPVDQADREGVLGDVDAQDVRLRRLGLLDADR